jgi:hypothetical protein
MSDTGVTPCGFATEVPSFSPRSARSARIEFSVSPYWPSPTDAWRTLPCASMRYSAGQYWLPQAFHVARSLSWATG